MSLNQIKAKWLAFINKMNKYGIPMPTVRDPRTGKGSITAALVVFSAGLFGFCILFILASTVAKWAGFFALTDMSIAQVKIAADYSFQFLLAALGGYLGRHLQKGDTMADNLEAVADEAVKAQIDATDHCSASKKSLKIDDPDQQ